MSTSDEHDTSDEDTSSEDSDAVSSSAQSEDEDGDDASQDSSTIDVTFEFFDPKETDFHGLKALLQNYLDGKEFPLSDFADLIIKQSTVGTVLKSAEDADPIGVLTVFNIAKHRDDDCMKQIKDYAMGKCENELLKSQFREAWSSSSSGLIVSERLINCPPQLAPPLQQALFDEMDWATEDEPSQELRDSFKMEHFICISRVFSEPSAVKSTETKPKRQRKEPLIVYSRPEDEFYHRHCTEAYTFPLDKPVAKDELQPMRLIMLLDRAQIDKARLDLDRVCGMRAEQ